MTQALKRVHFSVSVVVPADRVGEAVASVADDVSDAVKYGLVGTWTVVEDAPDGATADTEVDLDGLALGFNQQ